MYFVEDRNHKLNWNRPKTKRAKHTFTEQPLKPGIIVGSKLTFPSNNVIITMAIPLESLLTTCPRKLFKAFCDISFDVSVIIQEFPEFEKPLTLLNELKKNSLNRTGDYRILELMLSHDKDKGKSFVGIKFKVSRKNEENVKMYLNKKGLINFK